MQKNYKEYIEDILKSEKGIVKKRLLKWGAALNMCEMKQEEIQKIKRIKENGVKIYSSFENDIDNKRIVESYEKEIKHIAECIENIMEDKRIMDKYINELIPTEQEFLYLKYRKGYDFNYVALKMNVSRSSVFRIKDSAIDNLISIIKKYENEIF